MKRVIVGFAAVVAMLAVAASPAAAELKRIPEHYPKSQLKAYAKADSGFHTADHEPAYYIFWFEAYPDIPAQDAVGYCGEANWNVAIANQRAWTPGVNGTVGGNCPPGGNFSQKWVGETTSNGAGWLDCAYDEDNDYFDSSWNVGCQAFRTDRPFYERYTAISLEHNDNSVSCAEARYATAANLRNLFPVGAGGFGVHVFANCAGPHPSGSAKYTQSVSNDGQHFYETLIDEDPNITWMYVVEKDLHRSARPPEGSLIGNP